MLLLYLTMIDSPEDKTKFVVLYKKGYMKSIKSLMFYTAKEEGTLIERNILCKRLLWYH